MRLPRKELPLAAHRGAAKLLRQLAALWRRPGVARLRVVVHPGLRRTLGRYSRSAQRIELSPAVLSSKRLTDVLTHEAAHAALAQGKEKPARPHGPEWRQLMAQAGQPNARATSWCRSQEPEATKPEQEPRTARRAGPSARTATTYDHWCPVCQATRPARRPVRAWRCAACVAAGLEGRLEITPRVPQPRAPRAQAPRATAEP